MDKGDSRFGIIELGNTVGTRLRDLERGTRASIRDDHLLCVARQSVHGNKVAQYLQV